MFNMLKAVLFIVVFFYFFKLIASRIWRRFLLIFLYMIFVLLMKIFLISEDLSLSVSFLYFVIRCCFIAFMADRWYLRRRESIVVVWPM